MEESILDKVIDSQKSAVAMDFNPGQVLKLIITPLNDREVEVLNLRHGFEDNKKRTLEEIGKKFNVTRERIRQIENSALKKIKHTDSLEELLKPVESLTYQTLEEHGGIMHQDSLIKKILIIPGVSGNNISIANFILTNLLSDKLHYINNHKHFRDSWKLPTVNLDEIKSLIDGLTEIIKANSQPIDVKTVYEQAVANQDLPEITEELGEHVINSLLEISKNLSANPFKEWGLANWNLISLKRMSDKIYLILKKENEPLHFTDIASKINETGFDHKKANPATIHNELILDDKYILVGRGIYALKEWGYKPGVVADVIEDIIKEAGTPLSREQIIEKVLEKRMVKRSTIILALMNKKRFQKNAQGEYSLVTK